MKKIVILRHGRDTEKDERPLVAEEFADLKNTMKKKVEEALAGPVEKAFSSPLLRTKQTAEAISNVEVVSVEVLGKFPKFRPEVKQIAFEKGIDTSKSFFEVEGLNKGLQLSREQGGSEILNFLRSLKDEKAEKIVVVAHGGALDVVLFDIVAANTAACPRFFTYRIEDVLEKGEGFVVEMEDSELNFIKLLRR